ncbi:MAG: uroporphyrinogen-III synthase [Thermoanaerobaculia bacterium]
MTERSLHGRRIVVTRAVHQAAELVAAFEAAGATVVSLPLIEVAAAADPEPLARAAATLASFDWLAFTSANAVRAFLPWTAAATLPPVAAVGPATARALRCHGVEPRLEAEASRAEGLAEALAPAIEPGTRVLVPQAEDARPQLVDNLRTAGAEVTPVAAYRKRLPAASRALAGRLFADSPLGWVTFTSPRIVRHFAAVLGPSWKGRRDELRAISIGPVTSEELRRQGVEPTAEASRPSPEAMVRAVQESRIIDR